MADEGDDWMQKVMLGDEQESASTEPVSSEARAVVSDENAEGDDEGSGGCAVGWAQQKSEAESSNQAGGSAEATGGRTEEQQEEFKSKVKRRMSKMKKMVSELGLKQEKPGGLVDLSFLPQFASEEVKALNEEVLKAEKELRDVEESVEEQDERSAMMKEHMKRVSEEITFTQLRADAKRREVSTEENLKKISEMEARRLQREIRKIERDSEELNDRMRGLKAAINSGNEKMDEFRLLMQWNQVSA